MNLKVNKILNEDDFIPYIKCVESFKVINPFYKIWFSNNSLNKELRYFTFSNDKGKVLILMPFLLRETPYKENKKAFFDVASPYGYSGPLFNDDMSRGYLIKFWELVDLWYKKNNVVSEFVRFSLNHNFHFYSGKLTPTLTNVNGHIINEETQWSNFKQKVRNNYRKSLKHNLQSKLISKNELMSSDIESFHNVYIETMARIGASSDYKHSLQYFKNIINLSGDNFLLALIYKDDIVISVELILIAGDTLFSFLGGTLSDYFNYRPNDFLKIQVLKWARKNNYKYYLLGGGRENGDNLYQYKKSFFPNDNDLIFYTGRKIINKKVYLKLDKMLNKDDAIGEKNKASSKIELEDQTSFFPIYRKNEFTSN